MLSNKIIQKTKKFLSSPAGVACLLILPSLIVIFSVIISMTSEGLGNDKQGIFQSAHSQFSPTKGSQIFGAIFIITQDGLSYSNC